ncbi:MAG: single-stranded DNA-binding protein [Bacteroidaceae bacterium]|jgi:single-strand DNA-binding protein|nr:single-stranded DNA-binding protein [Bacteroidaceae bacterium]MBP5219097.1 single-stranded DNA-binding protein [Bacteroidaceae bacterium]MBQ1676934.1 single-stranded DNA-binding protein [Bacteroidaceae bacterium]MBQ3771549.1 single-stranded DNA-binding protein [Bacteroidaceae bacterium]MBQ3874000.1 single-stranded DNA-binding protein [Bacteroidaceae bacterium]
MSLNKVMLIGNLGRDPEVRYVMQDVPVATFTVATTEKGYRLANGTEVPDQTEWHNVVLWRGLAKIAEQYLHKGDKVYIEGKIKTRTYDDKNGVQKRITEIIADNMELLGGGRRPEQTVVAPAAVQQPVAQPEVQTSNDEQTPF